ncbi:hypothetical protein BN1708_007707 [Verticillium longisporum]|uniref:Uncharacterized protein n=1 Tax=Verticillium longisporum TaxID=100787 RepID=A0A0G4MVU1_VERLO|nr:hypothetical protein BN1708_007707 [Verticillium longisporum]
MTKCTILQNTATHSPPPCPAFAAHVLAPPCRAAAAGRLPRTISTAPRNQNRYGSENPRCLKTALWAPSQAVTAPPVQSRNRCYIDSAGRLNLDPKVVPIGHPSISPRQLFIT